MNRISIVYGRPAYLRLWYADMRRCFDMGIGHVHNIDDVRIDISRREHHVAFSKGIIWSPEWTCQERGLECFLASKSTCFLYGSINR